MKRAREVALVERRFDPRDGRLRFIFDLDGYRHAVHAIFHQPPPLPGPVWDRCLEELGLACLVDVATASLAHRARYPDYSGGALGRRVFLEAAQALRLEVLADEELSLRLLPLSFKPDGRRAAGRGKDLEIAAGDENRVLLLMGGGKDSLYIYQLLRAAGYEVHCFYLTEVRRTWQQLRRVQQALESEVQQHRAFLDINRRGVLDDRFDVGYRSQFQIGHVLATALPYALGHRCRFLALGLERSSDDPMVRYRGRDVNHQHQKSSPFLRLVNRQLKGRFGGAVQIVSPVHGLYDTGIYARFLRRDRSLVELQSSCGGATWRIPHCGQCDKCAFIAALLAGLSGDRKLYRRLFPRDPLGDPELFEEWLEEGADRPLTCAGHKEELLMALQLARSRGWDSEVLRLNADLLEAVATRRLLRRYLRAYKSPLLPPEMEARLRPLLEAEGLEALSSLQGLQ